MNRYSQNVFLKCFTRYNQSLRLIEKSTCYYSTLLRASFIIDRKDSSYVKNELFFSNKYSSIYKYDYEIIRNFTRESNGFSNNKNHSHHIHRRNKPNPINSSDPLGSIKPIKVLPNKIEEDNLGEELGGKLEKGKLNQVLIDLRENKNIQILSNEKGLNDKMFREVLTSFRQFLFESKSLPADLHIKLVDIINHACNETDLFPYFLEHAYKMYPHLNCMDDLAQTCDLTEPANWYTEARQMKRKIIYHAGPTNSGKTYSALQAFQTSESGIYCGPLKLLANEVYLKSNANDLKCDLVTGEERKFAIEENVPAQHLACTVEMVNLEKNYDVACIDEIQLISDKQRGWAWTRAFLGLKAKEIHVCGDMSAIDLISDLSFLTGDTMEVKKYTRLSKLNIMDQALKNFDSVEPGDCIVCFNKNDIFGITNVLEKRGHDVAVIYGSMPPAVKTAQASKFNDPKHKCKILVATDAIGMGINLNIRRIIFYSIKKPQLIDENDTRDENKQQYITTSQALQIAGRAGRFNTSFSDGYVTTFQQTDLKILKEILNNPLEKTVKAGLHPTADQIELFGFNLPDYSLSNLIQIFISICKIDNSQYFLCKFEDIKNLADLIDHIPVPLKQKYTFATSPINQRQTFVCSCFVKFVRMYSNNDQVTFEKIKLFIGWPINEPSDLAQLTHLESVYDLLDLYLWLSYRFQSIFCDRDRIIEMRSELESVIFKGVKKLLSSHEKFQMTLSPRFKKLLSSHLEINVNSSVNKNNNQNISEEKNENNSAPNGEKLKNNNLDFLENEIDSLILEKKEKNHIQINENKNLFAQKNNDIIYSNKNAERKKKHQLKTESNFENDVKTSKTQSINKNSENQRLDALFNELSDALSKNPDFLAKIQNLIKKNAQKKITTDQKKTQDFKKDSSQVDNKNNDIILNNIKEILKKSNLHKNIWEIKKSQQAKKDNVSMESYYIEPRKNGDNGDQWKNISKSINNFEANSEKKNE